MNGSSWLSRVDHLVVAVPELDAGVDHIGRLLGVLPTPGGRHPAWGTRNALLALGRATYLEIVGPDPERPGTESPTLFGIDHLDRPKLVTWAARGTSLESAVEASVQHGLDLGDVRGGSRTAPDGTVLEWVLTDPFADRAGGVVPFLIDWRATASPAGTAAPGCQLIDLRAEHPDVERVRRWVAHLDLRLPVVEGPRPTLMATIETPRGRADLV